MFLGDIKDVVGHLCPICGRKVLQREKLCKECEKKFKKMSQKNNEKK